MRFSFEIWQRIGDGLHAGSSVEIFIVTAYLHVAQAHTTVARFIALPLLTKHRKSMALNWIVYFVFLFFCSLEKSTNCRVCLQPCTRDSPRARACVRRQIECGWGECKCTALEERPSTGLACLWFSRFFFIHRTEISYAFEANCWLQFYNMIVCFVVREIRFDTHTYTPINTLMFVSANNSECRKNADTIRLTGKLFRQQLMAI